MGRWRMAMSLAALWLTAALFQQMVDFELDTLKGVRQILAGGETLSVAEFIALADAARPFLSVPRAESGP